MSMTPGSSPLTRAQATPANERSAIRIVDLRPRLFDAAVVVVLLIMVALSHGPVFGEGGGYVAALGGVAVGALVAFATAAWRVRAAGSALALLVSYLLFGGALALPTTTLFHVVPTGRTFQMLVLGVVTSWKDLLTVQPPAGVFVGPAIMPYLSALVASFVALTIVLRTKRQMWALVPIAVLLLSGILWGSQSAPLAPLLGLGSGLLCLAWVGALAARSRKEGSRGVVDFEGTGTRPAMRRRVGAIIMLAVAALVAAPSALALVGQGHRTVVRDYVEPPLDLREYHSPASQFRVYNTTDKDTELLTVDGLEEGGRLRLATLDYYDGTVIQIAGDAKGAGFRHVGTAFTDEPLPQGVSTNEMSIEILEYTGNWVPGGGTVRSLDYTSSRSRELSDALFYSDLLGTALSTLRLTSGDEYTVTTTVERQWSDEELEGRAFMTVVVPSDTAVPSVVAEVASELTADATPGISQVRAIQQKLHDQGFYSDGTDQQSLPGHRASRIERFLSEDQWIGDDDQYAIAMALMLRSLGIPSRVVMGFYSETSTSGPITFTGKDTHLWVEVPFEGAGWVAFDPTPPRDQIPQTEVPKPKPNPRPQVLQPPDPPQDPAELPPDNLEKDDGDEEGVPGWVGVLLTVLAWTGVGILVTSPLWLLLLIKARRTRRRRTRGTMDVRTAAAWDEVVDHATDLGVRVPVHSTRWDQAQRIDRALDTESATSTADSGFHRWDEETTPITAMAFLLDGAVFADGPVKEEQRVSAWRARRDVIASIRARVPWYRRLRAAVSTRSLRARRVRLRERLAAVLDRRERIAPKAKESVSAVTPTESKE